MEERTVEFLEIAREAGHLPGLDGRLNLPATQETADSLAQAVLRVVGDWSPGMPTLAVTLTGAAPVWAYLMIAHALHGRVVHLSYSVPNAPNFVIYCHGA